MSATLPEHESVEPGPPALQGDVEALPGLFALIHEIGIGMLTSRGVDGRLVSRAMATLPADGDADLTFVTSVETHKFDEVVHDPRVNVAYLDPRSRQWVSVSGEASVDRDRARIRRLYRPEWRAWFGDEGGGRDGGPEDDRIVLIDVWAVEASWCRVDASRPTTMVKVLAAMATGRRPDVGAMRRVSLQPRPR